jgi:hypothetical protein
VIWQRRHLDPKLVETDEPLLQDVPGDVGQAEDLEPEYRAHGAFWHAPPRAPARLDNVAHAFRGDSKPLLAVTRRCAMTPSAVAAGTVASVLLYGVLTIAALSLSVWVFYLATIGQFVYAGPPDWAIATTALAVLAITGGDALLGTHPTMGTILAAGGLAVTAIAFAGVYRPEDGTAAQVFKLGVTMLAICLGILARGWLDRALGVRFW